MALYPAFTSKALLPSVILQCALYPHLHHQIPLLFEFSQLDASRESKMVLGLRELLNAQLHLSSPRPVLVFLQARSSATLSSLEGLHSTQAPVLPERAGGNS